MSYPEPVYLGEKGEASATYRPNDHEPELVYPNGTRGHYLARGDMTHGLFGLYRWEMPAEPSGPGPHFHRTITESFYVLAGNVRIYDGREWIETGPGDFIHVPEGGVHGFRNESGAPAVDAHPFRSRRAARGLLRGKCPICPRRTAERRGNGRVLPRPRPVLSRLTPHHPDQPLKSTDDR